MSKTLSSDALAIGARYGATTHCDLSWNGIDRSTMFSVWCRTTGPLSRSPGLLAELQQLVREAGFNDQRLVQESPYKFRIYAR